MTFSIGEKIEAIRQEPEHVRMRYVMLCVSVVMVFIVGIWMLSVHESVTTTAADAPQALEQGKKDMMSGTPSLNDLFQQSAPLRIEDKSVEGSQFFQEEQNNRENMKNGDEGMLPPAGQ